MELGGTVDSVITLLKKMQDKWQCVFLVLEGTSITIDDDKQNSRSSSWKEAAPQFFLIFFISKPASFHDKLRLFCLSSSNLTWFKAW